MMHSHPHLSRDLDMPEPQAHQALMEEIVRLEEMAREWTSLFPQAAAQGQHWQKVLSQVQAHAAEDTCRLAVVGAVKSGKSTMINALVGQDLLKRGAGILTAMITRVQPGPESGAVLQFKGWDEINGEIRRALGLLPNPRLVDRAEPLNLQEAPDRELLAQVLAEAQEAELWTGGSLDQNYLLLKSYLEGYDLLKDLMPATGVLPLAGPDLARHRELVTREATAVYLKDVLLTIPFPWPAAGGGVRRLPGERLALSPAPGPGPGLSHQKRPGALRDQLPGGAAPGGLSVPGGAQKDGADAPYPGPAQPGPGGAHFL